MSDTKATVHASAQSFWEGGQAPRVMHDPPALVSRIDQILGSYFPASMQWALASTQDISTYQLNRAEEIVRNALNCTEAYASHIPWDILDNDFTWSAFRTIRPISKYELMASFPNGCLNRNFDRDAMYSTRSSGSSGETLDIRVDNEAMALDTIQGIRQVALQSGLQIAESCHIVHICTVPWPVSTVGESFVNHFISTLISPKEICDILQNLKADVISCYPSILLEVADLFHYSDYRPKLLITHSEQSRKIERDYISNIFGAPVLDEYSSEEATRIALELPCGNYHTCDDSVIVEILDQETLEPVQPGERGLVVITNLLNTAMPFVRYIQGDLAVAGSRCECPIGWGVIGSISGREGDSFLTNDGTLVPSGTLMDVCYRAMFDNEVSFPRFELIQLDTDKVVFKVDDSHFKVAQSVASSLAHLLQHAMGHEVHVMIKRSDPLLAGTSRSKRRPVRRVASLQKVG